MSFRRAPGQVASSAGRLELGAQSGRHIRRHRNAAHAARREEGQRQFIVARKLAEMLADPHAVVGHARQIAAGVLDGHDLVGIATRQLAYRFRLDVRHRARGTL
jgi:hypothetical protein